MDMPATSNTVVFATTAAQLFSTDSRAGRLPTVAFTTQGDPRQSPPVAPVPAGLTFTEPARLSVAWPDSVTLDQFGRPT